ncbi:profilin 1, isoform CRA_d, partial [Mus musculus]
ATRTRPPSGPPSPGRPSLALRQRPVKFFRQWADTWGPEMFCDPGLTAARRGIYNGSSYQEHRRSPHLQCHCHHDCQDASPADGQRRCPRWFDQQEML